jgi:hypothetical protein
MAETGEQRLTRGSWIRGHLISIALMSLAAVGVVILTVVALGRAPDDSGHLVGTAPADAQTATTITKGSRWLAGPGGRMFNTVNTDLARVMAAEQTSRRGAARAAGARLAADAAAALREPMPSVDAAAYRSALRQLEKGGRAAAAGRLGRKTARLLDAGEAGLMNVTAAAGQPGPAKTRRPRPSQAGNELKRNHSPKK